MFSYDSTEICDFADNNCDGETDEGVTVDLYPDTDGDGYGENAPGTVEQVNRFAHAEEKVVYFLIIQSYCIY